MHTKSNVLFVICRNKITGVLLQDGSKVEAEKYVLATGIMSNPIGRSVGITLPIYPLKGNVITVPLKVSPRP